ncbi:hypothetical protein WOLCODRAFT_54513, partial [Wolfiporia cocos MD-104 SS10]
VLAFIIQMAWQGFPLTHCYIKEAVDDICQAQYGDRFPQSGVGKHWTIHFLEKHSERVKPYWSCSLDHSR